MTPSHLILKDLEISNSLIHKVKITQIVSFISRKRVELLHMLLLAPTTLYMEGTMTPSNLFMSDLGRTKYRSLRFQSVTSGK